jgi:hypothetical protein
MWRKYRESITNKNLKRIRGRKTSLFYQNQILTVDEIFTYRVNKHNFYHFYVQGNLPHIQKNKRKTHFLAIELSKGSSVLLTNLIRRILKREASKRFFFIQYPLYSQTNIQYLLLLIRVEDDHNIVEYQNMLMTIHDEFLNVIDVLASYAFRNGVD